MSHLPASAELPFEDKVLAPRLRAIVRVLGLPMALHLLDVRGGRPIFLAARQTADSELARIVGVEAAQRLVDALGTRIDRTRVGNRIVEVRRRVKILDLPKVDKITQQIRNRAIRAERAGATLGDLATRYRLTRRQITNIVGDASEEPQRTPDLFGDGQ